MEKEGSIREVLEGLGFREGGTREVLGVSLIHSMFL